MYTGFKKDQAETERAISREFSLFTNVETKLTMHSYECVLICVFVFNRKLNTQLPYNVINTGDITNTSDCIYCP
jgi:hypothetical protein